MAGMRKIAWVLLLSPGISLASEQLWSLLERGGQTVLIRHTATAPGTGDPPGMRLDDCSTQRNLSAEGRAHAQRIGERFRGRGIPIDRVLSSPWCRCLETARLAFGKAEISQALGNLFGRHESRESQVRQMRVILGRGSGEGNWILVTHGSTIAALTGVSPATGEMIIVAPDAKVLGRLISD
jgi:broad specificity phosphatase PhoE